MSFLVVLGAIIFITLWRLNNWSNRIDIFRELTQVYVFGRFVGQSNLDWPKFIFDRASEHEACHIMLAPNCVRG